MKYCECGCGSMVNKNRTYVKGHNRQNIKMSEASKKKLSESKKGIPQSEEHKRKLAIIRTGSKASATTKKKMSETRKGRPAHNKGIKLTEEHKTKIREYRHTDVAREKISAASQGIHYDEWEAFSSKKEYCPKFDEMCRESNREKYDRKCFVCGKTEYENSRKLCVHHVDMDKAQGCESNWKLVPLCMACHGGAHNDKLIARLGYLIKED